MQRTQPDDAERAKDLLGWVAPGPARGDLMPSPQKVACAGIDIVVDGAVGHQPGAVAEVGGPPAQPAVEPSHDVTPAPLIPGPQHRSHGSLGPLDAFLRRFRRQIRMVGVGRQASGKILLIPEP